MADEIHGGDGNLPGQDTGGHSGRDRNIARRDADGHPPRRRVIGSVGGQPGQGRGQAGEHEASQGDPRQAGHGEPGPAYRPGANTAARNIDDYIARRRAGQDGGGPGGEPPDSRSDHVDARGRAGRGRSGRAGQPAGRGEQPPRLGVRVTDVPGAPRPDGNGAGGQSRGGAGGQPPNPDAGGPARPSRRSFLLGFGLGAVAGGAEIAGAGVGANALADAEPHKDTAKGSRTWLVIDTDPANDQARKDYLKDLNKKAAELAGYMAAEPIPDQGTKWDPIKSHIDLEATAKALLFLLEQQYGTDGFNLGITKVKKYGLPIKFTKISSPSENRTNAHPYSVQLPIIDEGANIPNQGVTANDNTDDFDLFSGLNYVAHEIVGDDVSNNIVNPRGNPALLVDAGVGLAGATLAAGVTEAKPMRRRTFGRVAASVLSALALGGAAVRANLGGREVHKYNEIFAGKGSNLGTGYSYNSLNTPYKPYAAFIDSTFNGKLIAPTEPHHTSGNS